MYHKTFILFTDTWNAVVDFLTTIFQPFTSGNLINYELKYVLKEGKSLLLSCFYLMFWKKDQVLL